jgi:hypothetical protein
VARFRRRWRGKGTSSNLIDEDEEGKGRGRKDTPFTMKLTIHHHPIIRDEYEDAYDDPVITDQPLSDLDNDPESRPSKRRCKV